MKLHRSIATGLMAAALLLSTAAHATIRKTTGGWLFGPAAVWTDGTTTNVIFHPMSDPLSAAGVINVRTTVELSEKINTCQIRPALRYSVDGVNWDTPKEVVVSAPGWTSSAGVGSTSAYIDITGAGFTPKPWVQFGVQVSNSAAGAFSMCNATLLVEPKEK